MEKGQGKRTDTLHTDNVFTRKEYIKREAALQALCEAVPVPPHGRLIDADALIIDLMDRGIEGVQTDDLREIQQAVMDAPTIIPAEEE